MLRPALRFQARHEGENSRSEIGICLAKGPIMSVCVYTTHRRQVWQAFPLTAAWPVLGRLAMPAAKSTGAALSLPERMPAEHAPPGLAIRGLTPALWRAHHFRGSGSRSRRRRIRRPPRHQRRRQEQPAENRRRPLAPHRRHRRRDGRQAPCITASPTWASRTCSIPGSPS